MKYLQHRDAALCLLFLLLCIGLFLLPSGFEKEQKTDTELARGRVVSADNSDVATQLIVRTGSQTLQCKLLNGPHKGQTIQVTNQLLGKMELDEVYRENETLLVQYDVNPEGRATRGIARGKYRLHLQLLLVVLFTLLLIAVGGWTGAKAVLSFAFAALLIWKGMLPLFLRGHNPIPIALAVVAALTGTISFLVGGINRKGLTTFLGALLGLVFTCVLAQLFLRGFQVHGAVRPFAETLMYSGFADLDLTAIFLASIFLAASGAVMDLAMDVAAGMHEIHAKHPDIGYWEHVGCGMRIGRSVVGTMTTTLLLAYSGSYIFMLMWFIAQGLPVPIMLNINYVSAEILNTLVGSFGLVTVAPFTALVGGAVMRGGKALRDKK